MDSLKKAFEKAATENYWSDPDSVSGPGSNLIQTQVIRKEIPGLLDKYGVRKMMDAPCGDLYWMKEILPEILEKGIHYFGADIVPDLIEKHNNTFKGLNATFYNIDLTTGAVPHVDLALTRDCFIHLSYSNILAILKNYKKSGIKYLLVSTYTNPSRRNYDVDGFYLYGRMLNLEKFPFNFPKPIELIVEGCTEGNGRFSDKSLALWRFSDLNLVKIETNVKVSLVLRLVKKIVKKGMSLVTKKG